MRQSIELLRILILKITDLQDRLEEAYAKIDDLENQARCYNFRILPETVEATVGLSETLEELTSVTYSLIQSAVLDIDEIHMEIDHIHRALVPLKSEGPPGMLLPNPTFSGLKKKSCITPENTLIWKWMAIKF